MAQSPSQSPVYQAVQMIDGVDSYDLTGKIYVIRNTESRTFTLQAVETMVREGKILGNLHQDAYIKTGTQEEGIWVVLPIVNKSSRELWLLSLGSISTGRLSSFRDMIVYNMNTQEQILETVSLYNSSKTVEDSIPIKIGKNQTNFIILFIQPKAANSGFLKISLSDGFSQNLAHDVWEWLAIIFCSSAFFYFIKMAKDKLSLSNLFMSLTWLLLSSVLLINSSFLYFGSMSWFTLYPFAWVFGSLFMIMALLFIKDGQQDIPFSLVAGLGTSCFFINIVGLVILKTWPSIGVWLIYAPVLLMHITIMAVTWTGNISNKRYAYSHIANTSFFLTMLIFWIFALEHSVVPHGVLTILMPSIILSIAAIVSILSHYNPAEALTEKPDISDVFLVESQLFKREVDQIQVAKEKSEHKRLMQVIEQERKLMSELQIKSAQQTEDMRRSKEAADEANRAKSAFLAVVSHEIRTPMTGIMGMLRLLQDTQLSKDQKEYTLTIKDSGEAMLALLNDILDFEKIESGKMDLENISFDLKRVIRSVYTLMRGHAEAKNISLELELDSQLPQFIYGDPTRLRQVLLNLINNAIKFTSKGSVYLRVRDLTGEKASSAGSMRQIYFAVQDSGIGVSNEAQKKLFMPFAQADTSISRKYGGTGLGLAICKRLIEAMGGAISINSKEGEGSTFFFTVTMAESVEVIEENNETMSSQKLNTATDTIDTSLKVLIVDDNGINQRVVSGFVDKIGCQSMCASNGADALDLMARHSFDLLLLDIELPDMNGLEVTKFIRNLAIPKKANIPIIALTGNTSDDDIKNYLDAGMNDFAAKPVTYEKIVEILNKVSQGSIAQQSISTPPIIVDFSDQDDEGGYTPKQVEISPLSAYSASVQTNTEGSHSSSYTDGMNDIDLDDDDSFANAVRQFEELEKNSSITPPEQSDTKEDILEDLDSVGLDESILGSLKTGLSPSQFQEILVSYYEKVDELIVEIGKAYLEPNPIALYARAHELKGMAGNFGFAELSRMCAVIEKAAKDNQLETAKNEVDRLGDHYAVARNFLNKWLLT